MTYSSPCAWLCGVRACIIWTRSAVTHSSPCADRGVLPAHCVKANLQHLVLCAVADISLTNDAWAGDNTLWTMRRSFADLRASPASHRLH